MPMLVSLQELQENEPLDFCLHVVDGAAVAHVLLARQRQPKLLQDFS